VKHRIWLILFSIILYCGLAAQVNGELTQQNGKWILQTWGTHQQRGYAQGYLLGQPIRDLFDNYFYTIVAMGDPVVYSGLVSFYQQHFAVEQKYLSEAQGLVDGMQASGISLYHSELQRDLDADDIMTVNCLVDLSYYDGFASGINGAGPQCSSLSSWATATQADSLLNGSVVISRLLDWNLDGTLIANPLLLVSHPSEPDEQKWISFTYPGFLGALSAISASGKAAFLNTGNIHTHNNLNGLHPILLSIRNGIEAADYNNDGTDNIIDIYNAVSYELSLAGTIIHAVSENPTILTGVIETNNSLGTVMRTLQDNDTLPGVHLAATNHFRLLNPPVCCTRYANIVDSLTANPYVTAKRQLAVLKGAAGLDNNMMALQYTPVTGAILWSTATSTQPAFMNQMDPLNRNTLLAFNTAAEDESQTPAISRLRVYPNPVRSNQEIRIESDDKSASALEVFNLKGQKIAVLKSVDGDYRWSGRNAQGKAAGAGVYLLKLQGRTGKNATARVLLLP
jgi:hypothetical protein